MERVAYDEFSMFHENAEEFGIPYEKPPEVRREQVATGDGRAISGLVWGSDPAELVLLHGGGQNAHTWDTVALALGRPLVALDLPGHGHSDGPANTPDGIGSNADDIAVATAALAPEAKAVVGMSAGGLTALTLAERAPDLVRKLVLVDILPSPDPTMAKRITDFVNGPETFDSFDAILARTVAFNPTRSESSLRRGILHNAVQLDDGTWQWRHRRHRVERAPDPEAAATRIVRLWDALANLQMPLLFVRGMAEGSVVTDEQEARLREVVPTARIERVEGAGHSVQGDKPVELAALLTSFCW